MLLGITETSLTLSSKISLVLDFKSCSSISHPRWMKGSGSSLFATYHSSSGSVCRYYTGSRDYGSLPCTRDHCGGSGTGVSVLRPGHNSFTLPYVRCISMLCCFKLEEEDVDNSFLSAIFNVICLFVLLHLKQALCYLTSCRCCLMGI